MLGSKWMHALPCGAPLTLWPPPKLQPSAQPFWMKSNATLGGAQAVSVTLFRE